MPEITAQPAADAAPQPGDWTQGLEPELKAMIASKGYKSTADLARAWQHAQSPIGPDKIPVPKDGKWHADALKKLGVPETPDAYAAAVKRPSLPDGVPWDDKFEAAMLPVAHEAGLAPWQVQKLIDAVAMHRAGEAESFGQSLAHAREEAEAELKREFGPRYAQSVEGATRAVRHFGGDDLIRFLDDTGLGDDPRLVRAFARIGAAMAEDTLRGGAASGLRLSRAEADAEIARIQGEAARDREHPYWNRMHPGHDALMQRLEALHRAGG